MPGFLQHLFGGGGFMPHGYCYLWNPGLIKLHLLTDLAIGCSYVAISLTLVYLVRKAKREIPFTWMFVAFGIFILACGATHFMEVWTLWTPVYWLSGIVKLVTASASVLTAILLPPLVPRSLALIRSVKLSEQRRAAMELTKGELELEVAERKRNVQEYSNLNADLERRVEARTEELAAANRGLAHMAAIIESSNDAILSLDPEQRILSWNPTAERMFGWSAEEVLGRSLSMLIPAGLSQKEPDPIEWRRRGEQSNSFEMTWVHKTGEQIRVHLRLSIVKAQAGEIQGTSVIAHEITEQKRAQEMLRLAVDAAPNAMVMVNGQGRIILVNSQTEKLFGYTRQELLGQDMEILVPPDYRRKHPEHRSGFMQSPHARAMGAGRDLYAVRKDGSEFPVEIGLNPIRTEEATWVLSAIVDITERKRAQEEITRLARDLEFRVAERTAELTEANAELEAFSYTVSHDLRAPLRQIAGFSSILAEECGTELSPESQKHLRRILEGAQQMGNLIDDLLNLAKIGRQAIGRRATPLNALVASAIDELAPELSGRDIDWQIEPLGSVECDPGLLKQVFINLLSNAIKFSRVRSRAVIQVGQTTVQGTRAFFVRDNGAGFDMQYAQKLFGVFQRLHRARDFEGTGVGLATVQRIVKKHGGSVWAEAVLDQGASFFFTIPESSEPVRAQLTPLAQPGDDHAHKPQCPSFAG